MKIRDNENLVVLGIFLALVSLLSALVLAVVSGFTARPISAAKKAREAQALRQILPEFDNDINAKTLTLKSPAKWRIQVRAARKNGKLVGYAALAVNPAGYAGAVKMLAGVNPDGTIRAILVTEQHETPGLGAELCKRQFSRTIFNLTEPTPAGLPPNRYLDQFNGRKVPAKGWVISKDGGDALYHTGATVTSRAIAKSASEIALAFQKGRRQLSKAFGGVK
ncbi:MAG: RnfABCDGE type electron transport complex subunit G [Lentisphaeria bacterium]|nr:RnfABCDGE type electron transport complex subunit G [Lentisphaeria bacterium]